MSTSNVATLGIREGWSENHSGLQTRDSRPYLFARFALLLRPAKQHSTAQYGSQTEDGSPNAKGYKNEPTEHYNRKEKRFIRIP